MNFINIWFHVPLFLYTGETDFEISTILLGYLLVYLDICRFWLLRHSQKSNVNMRLFLIYNPKLLLQIKTMLESK